VFQEAREGVYRFGAELLGRLGRGGEVGDDGGEGVAGEVLHEIVPQTKNQSKSALGCVAGGSLKGLDAREERVFGGRKKRTAFCAAGLFCRAVPMTHNACTLMSSEGVASRPCSGSHMPSFSRSDR